VEKDAKIFVAGGRGMVGSAIVRRLQAEGYTHVLAPTSQELDLMDQAATLRFFQEERPRYVFLAAAKVGGIWANATYPGEFIRNNLMIQTNVIEAARISGVDKLLFMGSSCIYPREAPQPIKEEYLLSGPLEETNKPYAVAKIAGVIMCQAYNRQWGTRFVSCMPTNLYGPGDNYHPEDSHVVPALIRRFHEAKLRGDDKVVVWGSGTPRRELMHVDDLARAALLIMERYEDDLPINVGSGQEVSIRELAEMIREVVGFPGRLEWDRSKPDGTPRKLLDCSRLEALGFRPQIDLRQGLTMTYQSFLVGQGRM
jgi:GDP-L-fucose synthase